MSRARPASIAWLLALLIPVAAGSACIEAPPSFESITLERAHLLLLDGATVLVEVAGPEQPTAIARSGSYRWELGEAGGGPPELPDGPVLLLARRPETGHRAAGLLARKRRGVFLLVSDNAEDRRRLYALRGPGGDAT